MRSLENLKERYNKIPKAAKASIWYTICSMIQKGIALLVTPIFTRIMSTEEYGIYTVYQSWYAIIIIFATLNMFYSAYNNVLTKWGDEKDISTASMQGLSTTITIILFAIYLVAHDQWNALFKLPTLVMVVLMIQLLFEPALNFWMVRQRYEYKYRSAVIVTLLISVIGTVVSVVLVLSSEQKGVYRVVAFALTQALFGAVFYIYHFLKGKVFFSKKYWPFTLRFCIPLIPHYLSFTVLNQADRIMISNMIGQGEAAIYSVAYTISMMMQIVTQAVTNSLTPYTYQSLKGNRLSGIKKTVNILLYSLLALCIMVMLLAPEVLVFFAPSEYHTAIYVMPPVVASTFFLFLYPLFSNVEFYYEKTHFIMIASSISALLNIALNWIFIPLYGFYAAGFTTVFCYIVMTGGHYFFYRYLIKKNNIDPAELYNNKAIGVCSIIIIIVMILCMLLYQYTFIRYCTIAILIMSLICFRRVIIDNIRLIKK